MEIEVKVRLSTNKAGEQDRRACGCCALVYRRKNQTQLVLHFQGEREAVVGCSAGDEGRKAFLPFDRTVRRNSQQSRASTLAEFDRHGTAS